MRISDWSSDLCSSDLNDDFRRVLYPGKNLQLVLMALQPGEEIGEEVHEDRDQFFRVEKGKGEVLIDGARSKVKSDDAIIVPAGARHNVINTGAKPLRLYRSEEHTSELQSLMRTSYAVFCLKKKNIKSHD